mmetsp:Transcript_14722/g.31082  ORF Transcript_14722/g.31082 Transcript_14722/m.31082 type:complete len:319 (+) Transcript_14722:471-1427(+)
MGGQRAVATLVMEPLAHGAGGPSETVMLRQRSVWTSRRGPCLLVCSGRGRRLRLFFRCLGRTRVTFSRRAGVDLDLGLCDCRRLLDVARRTSASSRRGGEQLREARGERDDEGAHRPQPRGVVAVASCAERAGERDPRRHDSQQNEKAHGDYFPGEAQRLPLVPRQEHKRHEEGDDGRDDEGVERLGLVLLVGRRLVGDERGEVDDFDDSARDQAYQRRDARFRRCLRMALRQTESKDTKAKTGPHRKVAVGRDGSCVLEGPFDGDDASANRPPDKQEEGNVCAVSLHAEHLLLRRVPLGVPHEQAGEEREDGAHDSD